MQDLSVASLEEVGERIRRNPVASLLIACGAGYVISKMLSAD